MAKRKTPKANKPSRVTNEELNSLQNIVNALNQIHLQIGQIEAQKHSLLHSLTNFNENLLKMRETLKSKYNTEDINIADGTINYNESN